MKIATILGARPQFIKAGPISEAIRSHNRTVNQNDERIEEVVIHTGQHYDREMSAVFFETLCLAPPKYNLGAGSGTHGKQIARMLEELEKVLELETPDFVMVYGDTNSTLAGALIADRLQIPIAHVEAGLRSFNRRMPEECNRVVADHLATLLFAPTRTALENLAHEGITDGVYLVGDVMYEASMAQSKRAEEQSTILRKLNLVPLQYSLATVHRAENTDNAARLGCIVEGLLDVSRSQTLIWPVHPRARKQLPAALADELADNGLVLTEPLSYHDMLALEKSARVVLTDSGGVQKEAFWFGVPCVTLRDETEWVETVAAGRNELAGCDPVRIRALFESALRKPRAEFRHEGNEVAPSISVIKHLCGFAARRHGEVEYAT